MQYVRNELEKSKEYIQRIIKNRNSTQSLVDQGRKRARERHKLRTYQMEEVVDKIDEAIDAIGILLGEDK